MIGPKGRLVIETTDPEYLKTSGIYEEFPRMVDIDLPRWPVIQHLENLARKAGFVSFYSREITLFRGWESIEERLKITKERARTGVGPSFWRLLTEEERWAHFYRLSEDLPKHYPDGKVPRQWTSTFLVASKA
jgi:hypothetical protein